MNELKVNLENCYGISNLNFDFKFEEKDAFIIYASNGLMKTSFTKTIDDLCNGETPTEEIYNRITNCRIVDEKDVPISSENTFVVKSYDESYSSKNVSSLLMNESLKAEYDDITKDIIKQKEQFISHMDYSFPKGTTFESEFMSTYSYDDMLKGLEEIFDNGIGSAYNLDFTKIPYSDLFNDKVKDFIDKNYKELMEYKNEYEELINNCSYFKQGKFSQYNADNVSLSLRENGYFEAGHKLILNDNSSIISSNEFNKLLEKEKEKVFTNPKLRKKFDKINKNLSKNTQLRNFRKVIENDLDLISELVPFDAFKKKCWNSILKSNYPEIKSLITEYKSAKIKIEEIQKKARKQNSDWEYVIRIFSERFHVPFTVSIGNQEDVVLKNSVPTFVFTYQDKFTNEKATIDRGKLNALLSGGERRALYLMNIIFELEALRKSNKEMLIICDDIAESFDYKNKHAIIEYLYDNYNSGNFKFIILTHNFDFFRTVSSRILSNKREYCLMANYDSVSNEIKLGNGKYLNSVFNYWHQRINKSNSILIAVIPFIRNIIEYTKSINDKDYLLLTNLLHYKKFSDPSTDKITLIDLNNVIKKIWNDVNIIDSTNANKTVLSLIITESINIMNSKDDDKVDLEDKIVMSIASRLIGEKLLVDKLVECGTSEDDIKNIDRNQTAKLIDLYKKAFGRDDELLKIVEPISLFTAENIHLNSFMYEPLIDTSPNELKRILGTLIPTYTNL